MIKKKSISNLIYLFLTALAVSPAFVLGDGNRNFFLICVMFLSPIVIIYYGNFKIINKTLVLFILTIIILPTLSHPSSVRWSTVLYSVMFCFTFLAYDQLLYQKSLNPKNYQKLLKYLIITYFIVLVIQQFCVLTGLPIFNVSNYDASSPWKLNSLSAEPAHSGRVVALLMYCYISIKEILFKRNYNFSIDFKVDKWVWISFIWTMITMNSGTAFLFLFIFLLKFLSFKRIIQFILISSMLFIFISNLNLESFDRTKNIALATITLDEETSTLR